MSEIIWHGTTILSVRKGGVVVIAGDGQVSMGPTIVKANARKVRRLGKGEVICGFAGATHASTVNAAPASAPPSTRRSPSPSARNCDGCFAAPVPNGCGGGPWSR